MEEETKANKINIIIVFLYANVLTSFNLYYFYLQDNRLNEHKKVIELMNEANKSQQESIKLLMKNQILLNNKLKRYELNK